ncbi:MAG TPA: DEAD/DEAH box helicase family protein [Sulfurimonas sp.]|uniref:type I restriction endonuclease subunit R n=1 Tax=Sulfurimonas sp. TaxID=2022749 RepID=UPI002B9FA9FD|nr:DEAD/DEAH box helicase family protein [Sulfurimonas sp.]HUH41583.1 DEAD/DEAH box helicase family protein [Sulfurimonas sp.]
MNETQTRINLIDDELIKCGWHIDDITKVIKEKEIEVDEDLPPFFDKTKRFIDYALLNKSGQIIAIVEAKRENKNVGSAKTQAEYYARRIKNSQGFAPFIYITNGHEIEFWDSENYPLREALSYHSLEDLETYRKRNDNNIKLSAELINKTIAGRYYQINAVAKTLEVLNAKERSVLWVMATGTGKTRTVISLVDVLLRAGFVKRVLFLADRRELARQGLDDFKEHMSEQSRERIEANSFERDKRIYVSTFQTMMSLLKTTEISQGFFDLIIADESHRSIYNFYGDLFKKFDAIKMGLTATPVEFADRDTYKFFGTDGGNPTFAYTYEEALNDGFLSPYDVVDVKTDFLADGIHFELLPKAEQERLLVDGYEAEEIDFEGSSVEKMVKNDDTNRLILKTLIEDGYKNPLTNLPAKTIIFAINKTHAHRLAKLFDELYPHYNSQVAKVIVSDLNNADELIKQFKDEKSEFNIAISVGMLDTGIDVPSIMNLVFAKPVFSKAKFWQMIGRGTRLYDGDFKKERFVIFDFWGNFTYFNEQPNGETPKEQISLHRQIFEQNLELLKNLEGENLQTIKKEIQEQIKSIPKDDYFVKQHSAILAPFINDFENNLSHLSTISKLFDRVTVKNYAELRFRLQSKKLQTHKIIQDDEKLQKSIEKTVTDVMLLQNTISDVKKQEELIESAKDGLFWLELDFVEQNAITNILAPLMVYKSKRDDIKEYHFDLKDAIKSRTNISINHASVNLKAYEEHIKKVIQSMVNESYMLQQLFLGVALSEEDIKTLKNELLKEDIHVEQLSQIYECKSDDLVEIFKAIINKKEYKLPHLLDEFLKTHTLSSKQIEFIKAIKHYVQEKRDISRKDLTQNPFTKFHKMGIMGMFQGSMMNELVAIIDDKEESL